MILQQIMLVRARSTVQLQEIIQQQHLPRQALQQHHQQQHFLHETVDPTINSCACRQCCVLSKVVPVLSKACSDSCSVQLQKIHIWQLAASEKRLKRLYVFFAALAAPYGAATDERKQLLGTS